MFHGYLDYFQKPPLGGRPNTKLGDDGTPNAHNRWFILFFLSCVRGPTWIKIHWNSIWLRFRSHMASHYTWGFVTTLRDFEGALGRPLDTSLLGSHNFMVTVLGLCVEWPSTKYLGSFGLVHVIFLWSRIPRGLVVGCHFLVYKWGVLGGDFGLVTVMFAIEVLQIVLGKK